MVENGLGFSSKRSLRLIFKLHNYCKLLRLDKPIGIWLLLWPTLMALWIASHGKPDPFLILIFSAGVIVMRSAGCVINDWADQTFDASVERCKTRPLVLKTVSSKEAGFIFGVLIFLAFLLILPLNTKTQWLSLPALLLAIIYPFMKRYFEAPQLILGLAFGFSIPMAFAATQNTIPLEAWLLYAATISWVMAYDTQYAMVDRIDDLKIGVKSTAILFGSADRFLVGLFQMLFLLLFCYLGFLLHVRLPFYLGVILALGVIFSQMNLISKREPKACFLAFKRNAFLGGILFLSLVFGY